MRAKGKKPLKKLKPKQRCWAIYENDENTHCDVYADTYVKALEQVLLDQGLELVEWKSA